MRKPPTRYITLDGDTAHQEIERRDKKIKKLTSEKYALVKKLEEIATSRDMWRKEAERLQTRLLERMEVRDGRA